VAEFAVHGTWRSVWALTALFAFVGLVVYSIAGGFPQDPAAGATHPLPLVGLTIYGLAVLTIALGFWSKEDAIAVLGIMGLAALVILDVLLRIGILSYNGVQVL
jgi:ABC-type uncharacterized transport system permease subunit